MVKKKEKEEEEEDKGEEEPVVQVGLLSINFLTDHGELDRELDSIRNISDSSFPSILPIANTRFAFWNEICELIRRNWIVWIVTTERRSVIESSLVNAIVREGKPYALQLLLPDQEI